MAKDLYGHQIEAPLPADRVINQKPFAVTGIDFARPFSIKVRSTIRKGYIAPFTCATTRAVHLELCTDMLNEKFFWLSNDSWLDYDCHTPFTWKTLRPFIPPTNISLKYGPLYLQPKVTNSSLITTLVGSLLLRGQIGGEDGGR